MSISFPSSGPDNLSGPFRYATFVRIGTGLTIEDYDWVNKKKWIRMDRKAPPPHLKTSPSSKGEDKGDVYLDPEECVIFGLTFLSYRAILS